LDALALPSLLHLHETRLEFQEVTELVEALTSLGSSAADRRVVTACLDILSLHQDLDGLQKLFDAGLSAVLGDSTEAAAQFLSSTLGSLWRRGEVSLSLRLLVDALEGLPRERFQAARDGVAAAWERLGREFRYLPDLPGTLALLSGKAED